MSKGKSINQIRAGSVLTYVQMAFSILISLIYTPVMLRILGKSEFGLYNVVASTTAMLSLLSLGFGSSYIRYFTKYRKGNEEDKIASLNGLFFLIFIVIGIVALACGLFLSFNLEYVFQDGLDAAQYSRARIMMILLTINMAVSFPMSVYGNIISAHEKFVFLKSVGVLNTVISPLVTLPVLLAGYGSVGMVVVTLAVSIVSWVAQIYFCVRKLRIRVTFNNFEKGLFKEIAVYSSFVAINIVIDEINNNIDPLLITRFCGTAVTAVYAVGQQLRGFYVRFSVAVSSVFTPRIHGIVQKYKEDKATLREKLTSIFTKVGRIQFLILALVCSGLVFFGKQFIYFWAGPGYEDAYYVVLIISIPGTIPLIQNLGIEIQRAQFLHQYRSIIYGIMAIGNLILTIYLCQIWGAVGAAIGTGAAMLIANGLIMNILYHKKINIDVIAFWKSILSMIPGMLVPIAAGVLGTALLNFYSVPMLLGGIIVYTLIYCASVWLMSMNTYEKSIVTNMLGKLRRH